MAKDTAAALGASDDTPIIIAGKECHYRPLTAKELSEIDMICLKNHKRAYLETLNDNRDLIPNFEAYFQSELQKVGKWDVSDLPTKWAYDASKIKVTKKLKQWLNGRYDIDETDESAKRGSKEALNEYYKRLAGVSLDQGSLTEDDYRNLTGAEHPPKYKIGYSHWWISATTDGMLTLCWKAFAADGLTLEQVKSELTQKPQLLAEVSNKIEHLSAVHMGNGEG